MIPDRLRALFSVRHFYPNPVHRQRAQGLIYFALIYGAVWLSAALFIVLPELVIEQRITIGSIIMLTIPPLLIGFDIRLIQAGKLKRATWLAIFILVPFVLVGLSNQGINSSASVGVALLLMLTGSLLDRRWLAALIVVMAASVILLAQIEYESPTALFSTEYIPGFMAGVLILAFLFIFGGGTEQIADEHIDTIKHLHMIGQFAGRSYSKTEIEVFTEVINVIRSDLGHDFAQVFFVDEQDNLTRQLRLSLGTDAKSVLSPATVGESSALVDVLRTKQPVHVSSHEHLIRREHFLSSIRFGLAVPVIVEDRVVAILDIQNMADRFTAHECAVLSTLAGVVAGIVVKTRATHALRENVAERQTATEHLQTQLRELKHTERQVTGGDWITYLEGRGAEAVGFDANGGDYSLTPAYDLPPELHQALQNGQVYVAVEADEQIITIPIMLRDEVLGAMAFAVPLEQTIPEQVLGTAQNIARRLAVALENKRLFEQSRTQAVRERKAGEIAGRLIGATDVESVLALAAESFNEALGAVRTQIHLQPDALDEDRTTGRSRGILA